MGALVRIVGVDGGSEVVVDLAAGTPVIRYWGAQLGDVDPDTVVAALERPIVQGAMDAVAPLSVVPEHGSGHVGRPGLQGRRGGGRAWSPRFRPDGHDLVDDGLVVCAVDEQAGLALRTEIRFDHVLSISNQVTNLGDRRYSLDDLSVTVPLPEHLDELLVFEGRWSREFHERRQSWTHGVHSIENRQGRTSHERPPLLFAGRRGFGEWDGEVVGAHVAWSGNHRLLVERLADGRRYVQGGELLHPGEVVLEPGESYATPPLVLTRSDDGLTAATWGFHRALRAAPAHPTTARPVLLNTWEAVYFDHDLAKLKALAASAADLGVERFVLDDGWFGSRRDDSSGLGDWWVSEAVYPDGLAPLIDHVTGLGMDFGIWVEPEMVNPDSDVYRAHPEWALATEGYEPVLGRQQLVLDLGNPEAFEFIRSHLDELLARHDIAYVKWDMNRDHIQGSGADGAAGSHAQTVALTRLLDELRAAHPEVEFESCASGGGRIDHHILQRAERVWTSDCNDALERQRIQRGASMLIPPEVMGAHIGPTRSHTTGRVHSLSFRAITAMFGHLGVEWNVTTLDPSEAEGLRAAIATYKGHRELLHGGDVVRFDTEPAYCAHGVYAPDRSEALVSFAQLTTARSQTAPPLRLPGLDPTARYRVTHVPVVFTSWGPSRTHPAWLAEGIVLTGAQLAAHGIQTPVLHPESAVLLHLTRL